MTPAEDAATARKWIESFDCPYRDVVDPGMHSGCRFCADKEDALAALDALLAQAEAAEEYPPGTTNLERHLTECLRTAEAERDAAREGRNQQALWATEQEERAGAAEANAREERKARKAVEAIKSEEVAIARTNWTARLEAAEAERDAAVRAAAEWEARCKNAEDDIEFEHAAAEQAQAALRKAELALMCEPVQHVMVLKAVRAALTGEGTE